jgi:hypothetical protein
MVSCRSTWAIHSRTLSQKRKEKTKGKEGRKGGRERRRRRRKEVRREGRREEGRKEEEKRISIAKVMGGLVVGHLPGIVGRNGGLDGGTAAGPRNEWNFPTLLIQPRKWLSWTSEGHLQMETEVAAKKWLKTAQLMSLFLFHSLHGTLPGHLPKPSTCFIFSFPIFSPGNSSSPTVRMTLGKSSMVE